MCLVSVVGKLISNRVAAMRLIIFIIESFRLVNEWRSFSGCVQQLPGGCLSKPDGLMLIPFVTQY